jgi:uncharacterized protein YbcI
MKTQGGIEGVICEGISQFEQEYMGRRPKDIRVHLIGDLLVVRLQGVLTVAEQHLVKSLPAEKGRDLLKQVRTDLRETARPLLETMVQEITGKKTISMHHDISTVTGEEIVLFTLVDAPHIRQTQSNNRRTTTSYSGQATKERLPENAVSRRGDNPSTVTSRTDRVAHHMVDT